MRKTLEALSDRLLSVFVAKADVGAGCRLTRGTSTATAVSAVDTVAAAGRTARARPSVVPASRIGSADSDPSL
jgi:hypothetical protein